MSGAPPDLTTRQRLLADLFAILPERETAALVAEMTLTTANSIADMVTALLSPAGDIVELDTVEGLLAAYAMARKRLLEELALLADAEKCAAFAGPRCSCTGCSAAARRRPRHGSPNG